MKSLRQDLEEQLKQKKALENEVKNLKQQLLHLSYEADEVSHLLACHASLVYLCMEKSCIFTFCLKLSSFRSTGFLDQEKPRQGTCKDIHWVGFSSDEP